MHMMFEHMFAEMNEILDEISQKYPSANGVKKQELDYKWNLLKDMSDGIIEEWLSFEEKLGVLQKNCGHSSNYSHPKPSNEEIMRQTDFVKAQGYYKLLMFEQAHRLFLQLQSHYPQSDLIYTYLGMCAMHLQHYSEAVEYMGKVLELTSSPRTRAIIYNALGCIAATDKRMAEAKEYFLLAHHNDETLDEPVQNLKSCQQNNGQLFISNQFSPLA